MDRQAAVDGTDRRTLKEGDASATPVAGGCVSVQELWREYLRRSQFHHRYLRIFIPCVFCLAAYWALPHFLGAPLAPARGALARVVDDVLRWLGAAGFIVLTMQVLDGALLNIRFISYLIRADTHWPECVLAERDKFGLQGNRQSLSEYLDIRLIAMRTRVVGAHIYYPFLVLFLLVAARSSVFDNWSWTPGIMLPIAGGLGIALVGAWSLRRAAEHAREVSLKKLKERRERAAVAAAAAAVQPPGRPLADCLDEMIKEVKEEKEGAFSVLSQYPTLSAILLPSGGLGLWALVEYLVKQAA